MQTTGILLLQLGTPDAPTTAALKPYLRQFLSDPRVIHIAATLRWRLILNLFILPSRPKQSAAKYRRIWHPTTGSPLLHWTRRQTEDLQKVLPQVPVTFGMQIGNPGVREAMRTLIGKGVERLLVLPMYPQYSATTTASAMDALFKVLVDETRVPALRVVPPYYQDEAYLDAVAAVARDDLARLTREPEHYLISFHGIPIRYAQAGDTYATHVKRTTRALVERLGWPRENWTQTFQSLFGREEWLKPYTEATLRELARRGMKRVWIMTPGFTADCLETLDELGNEAREAFIHVGGQELHLCPCLNDHPAWIAGMKKLLLREGQGWL
jgi:ferrochelatase